MTLDFSIEVTRGDFHRVLAGSFASTMTGLTGPSGSGKTTLLQCLCGLQHPCRGRIYLGDTPLFDTETGLNCPPHKRGIGMVFQNGLLFPHLTVEKNLAFGLRESRQEEPGSKKNGRSFSQGRRYRREQVEETADVLGIGDLLNRMPRNLSGGETQKVALGRAVLAGPSFLLLDEPLSAVDEERRPELIEYLRRIHTMCRLPMVVVSHDTAELRNYTVSQVSIRELQENALGWE